MPDSVGNGNYSRKASAKHGFVAGVKAMMSDRELRIAHQSIDGVMTDDIDRAFERWWNTKPLWRSRRK